MIVFAQKEFDGMDVDRIDVGPAGCLLMMMMFVNESIDCLDM